MFRLIGRSLLVLVLMSFFATSVMAQGGYKVSAVSVGTGQTPISSGISAYVDLTTDKGGFLEVMAQAEQGWLMGGHDWKSAGGSVCSLYWSVGFFEEAPWVGPYAGCNLKVGTLNGKDVKVGAMTWPGFYIGKEPRDWANDNRSNNEPMKAGWFETASASVGGLSVSLAHLNFLNDPTNWLPGVGYSQTVGGGIDVSGSLTWNKNSESLMYFVGATWHPK